MKHHIITSSISLLLIGSVLAVSFEPLASFGYGYGYGYDYDYVEYGYGYGTTADTTADTSTSTNTTSSNTNSSTGDTLDDVDHEVIVEVPSDSSTDQTTENNESCAVDKPNHLKVRHKNDRMVLHWRRATGTCPSSSVAGYIVRIKTKRGKLVVRTETVEQLQYRVGRKKLKKNKVYTFAVRAVLETGEKSAWSKQKRFRY